MKWIGLTGGIASGKSSVASRLKARGYAVVDADELARRAVAAGTPGLQKITRVFGPDVIGKDGELDRVAVGRLIFANPDLRRALEEIIHPEVRRLSLEEKNKIAAKGALIAFYDVPLLFEKKMEKSFDSIVVVASSEELQRTRLGLRNKLSKEEIENRLVAQLPIAQKIPLAEFVIRNDGSLEDLDHNVENFLIQLKKKFKI